MTNSLLESYVDARRGTILDIREELTRVLLRAI
jgi:hypothetical protein